MPRGQRWSRSRAPLRSPLSKLPLSLLAMTSSNEGGWVRVHCGTLAQPIVETPLSARRRRDRRLVEQISRKRTARSHHVEADEASLHVEVEDDVDAVLKDRHLGTGV